MSAVTLEALMSCLYATQETMDRWFRGEFRSVKGLRCVVRFNAVSAWLAEVRDEYICRYYPEAGAMCESGFLLSHLPAHEERFVRKLSLIVREFELKGMVILVKPPRNYADVAQLYAPPR